MSFKVLVLFAAAAVANAGYLDQGLRYAAPAPIAYHAPAPIAYHAPAPVVSHISPAITKTDFIPGSYSSSYRSDVITPRVKYTETPGYSYAVPQPPAIGYQPTVTKVASLEPVAPIIRALPAIAPAHVAGLGYAHGIGGLGYAGAAVNGILPAAHAGFGLAAPLAGGYNLGYSKYGAHY